jgi:hypothetical protein
MNYFHKKFGKPPLGVTNFSALFFKHPKARSDVDLTYDIKYVIVLRGIIITLYGYLTASLRTYYEF